MEKDCKARQDRLDADNAKVDANRERRKPLMKLWREWRLKKKAERIACEEKMMAQWEAY
jgi:hypothetical protein